MTDEQAKNWMKQMAGEGAEARLPAFDRVWAMRRLEQEFERRQRAAAPLVWLDVVAQAGTAAAAAVVLAWWVTLG